MLESPTSGKDLAHAYRGGRRSRAAALTRVACVLSLTALSLTGCGDSADPPDAYSAGADPLDRYAVSEPAASGGAGPPDAAGAAQEPTASPSPSGAAHATEAERARQLARGEILSFSCRPCHGLAPGDESPVGPHLHGMFGRAAAGVAGFEYSAALRQSGIVWTEETLDAWLAQPEAFLPGNDMDFAGFRSADDRRALIAYLRERTAAGVAVDAAQPSGRASN